MHDTIRQLNDALQGSYRIERELGEGGMATVYLADDLKHHRRVAVKVLKPSLAAMVGGARFLAEIRTTARLQHPHILPLFDSGQADDFLYYVMPYIDGESLRARVDREGRLPIAESVGIVTLVGGALQYAHDHGVIHRDVKPDNILLSGDLPIMADFGISLAVEHAGEGRLTNSGVALGTPRYASPEQATGDGPVDARSDVYSLACVLYELITGEIPHTAKASQAIVAKRLTEPPTPLRALRRTVPRGLEAAVLRALQPTPADRQQTVAEFVRAVGEGAEDTGALEPRQAPSEPVAPAPTQLVGRAKERAELLSRLDDLAKGRGSLTLIGGEPGVGKTRLAEFVLEEARRRGFMCVVGHAYELEGTPPFMPFIEQLEYTARVVPEEAFRLALGDAASEIARVMPALRSQFTDIGPSIELPPDQTRHYLFHRYREFVERASRVAPLVVLFDDLHWADEGSLLLVEHLVRHLHGMSMMAIGTYREAELGVGRPLAASLERLLRSHNVQRISLKRLTEAEVAGLLEALGGSAPPETLVSRVFHETEGNPFFAQEVFRHLQEEGVLFDEDGAWRQDLGTRSLNVPESVRLVVGKRLERVGDACRKVLTTASVVGPRFEVSVLENVGDAETDALLDALEEAEAAQLIQPVHGRRDPAYQFTHELIRQTLIEALSIPRRQRLHVKIAAAVERAHGKRIEEHASEMAYHLYQAGAAADVDRTLRFLRLAGDQALSRAGYEDALAQYERALSLEDDVPKELEPVLLEGMVRALDGMARWADVVEMGKRALAAYEDVGDTDGIARVARLVCYRLDWRGRYRQAVEVGRRALTALEDAPGPHRARLRCQVGVAVDLVNEPGGRSLIEEGIAEGRQFGDEWAILQGLMCLKTWQYHQGDFAEAVRLEPEDRRLLEQSPHQMPRVDYLWLRALLLPFLGRLDEAVGAIAEAREVGRQRHELTTQVTAALGELAVAAMRTGEGRTLEAMGRSLTATWRKTGGWANAGAFYAGLGVFWQGDTAGAMELMDVDDSDAREARLWNAMADGWRFRAAAYAGMPGAHELYEAVEPRLYQIGRRAYPGDAFGLHAVIEGMAVIGNVDAAAELHMHALDSLKSGIVGHMDGLWACTTGLAAACAEEWEEAEERFRTAVRQADEVPHRMGALESRRWWGWSLLRRGARGDRERAREILDEAIEGYRQLQAPRLEVVARELRDRAG